MGKLKINRGDTDTISMNVYTDQYWSEFNVSGYTPRLYIYEDIQTILLNTTGVTGSTNVVSFTLTSEQTNIKPGNYTYEIEVEKPNNKKTIVKGDIEIMKNI